MLRPLHALRQRLRGSDGLHPALALRPPHVHLGSDYAGYSVCTVGLNARSVVYSLGIGEDVSFDLALIARYGPTVHCFDPTPRSLTWLAEQNPPAKLIVHPWAVGGYDGSATFSPPVDPSHISHTMLPRSTPSAEPFEVQVLRLPTIMRQLGHQHIDVLKMDIEGAEYDVLDDMLRSRLPVGQLLVEFHHHLPSVPDARTQRSIERLKGAGYRLFAISDNGHEMSWLVRSRPAGALRNSLTSPKG